MRHAAPLAASSGHYKKGHLTRLQCKRPHPFTPERYGLSASCLRAQSPRDLQRSVLTDPGGQLYWLLEACPREPGTKPQGLSPTRALLLPSWGSDVKLCCWGNVIGREPVENGLLVESGNGRIWKHLAVCTDGRAVPLKRLLFKVKLSNPFCSSNLCLVHMTFF